MHSAIADIGVASPSPACNSSSFNSFAINVHACLLAKSLSCVQLFATLWPIIHRAPLSMGFSRQEYWSWSSCPPPGDLLHPGIKPMSCTSPALADGLFTTSATWEAPLSLMHCFKRSLLKYLGFPGGVSGKEPACQCRRL